MLQVCAWCGTEYGKLSVDATSEIQITHGICANCRSSFFSELGLSVKEYLDTLDAPILLVNENAECLLANESACKLLGSEAPEMEGELLGRLFECKHAQEQGGCGRTIHCSGCTIRRTVTETHETGVFYSREPASLRILSVDESCEAELYISTEKADNIVLLRIDDIHKLSTI